MNYNSRFVTILSLIIAIGIVGAALWYRDKKNEVDVQLSASVPVMGEIESAHEHMSILMVIDGTPFNFNQQRYMLKDLYAHFEDADGTSIHKHATGVTLPYFLSTLGINITASCVSLDTGRQYCDLPTEEKELRVFMNGIEREDIASYELRHEDKILINYGDDDEDALLFKLNSVPDLPEALL